jgi:hypothetical protein
MVILARTRPRIPPQRLPSHDRDGVELLQFGTTQNRGRAWRRRTKLLAFELHRFE